MTDGVSFTLTGLDEVLQKLETVQHETQYKAGRFALRKAANVVRDTIKRGAERLDDPTTAEDVSKNIAIRWSGKQFRRTGDLAFRVGVLGGARQQEQKGAAAPGGHTYYWRFLEFGTSKMPARPFVRTALSENIQRASQEFVTHYGAALDRAIKRAGKS